MHNSGQAASQRRIQKKVLRFSYRYFEVVLLALSATAALFFVVQAYHYLPVISDNMYPEASGVVSALSWAKGEPLYQDFRQPPFMVTSFPPLWYVALGWAGKVGRLDIDALTVLGRVWSLVSLFAVVGLGFIWNKKLGLQSAASAIGALLFLSFPILIPWAVTARPDIPALLFSFAAIFLIGREVGTKGTILAALSATIAFLMRHSSVSAPLAIVLWLAYRRKWKQAALFCVVWWGIVASVLVSMQVSSGGLFLLNLGGSKFGSMALTYVRDSVLRMLISPDSGFAVALVVFGAFGAVESLKARNPQNQLICIYLLASLGFGFIGSAAAGAAVNHFIEPGLAFSVLAPFGLATLRKEWSPEASWTTFAVLFTAVLLLPSLDVHRWNAMHNKPDNLTRVRTLIGNGRVFTDIPYLGARSSDPQFLDPASLTYAARNPKLWSAGYLAAQLESKSYDLVVLSESPREAYDPNARYPRYPHLGSDLRSAIVTNYESCTEIDKVYIYLPKAADQTPNTACVLLRSRLD